MRLRDQPTMEVSGVLSVDLDAAWDLVTDITLPTRNEGELQSVSWCDGSDRVELGARFEGNNAGEHLGEWTTQCRVVECEPGRRWVYAVSLADGEPMAWWGFEVEPSRRGTVVRQFAKIGPADSGLTAAAASMPEKEGRLVALRLEVWRRAMAANLDGLGATRD